MDFIPKKQQFKVLFELIPIKRPHVLKHRTETWLVKRPFSRVFSTTERDFYIAGEVIRGKQENPNEWRVVVSLSQMTDGYNARFFEKNNPDRVIDLTKETS